MDDRTLNQKIIDQHLRLLETLQYDSGLFAASKRGVETGYDKAWLRDNFYECLAFEVMGEEDIVRKTYRAILNIFKKHEYKIDFAIAKKPSYTHQYIHARYHPETFDEFWEEWGNKQNDAIGCILFKVGTLERDHKGLLALDEDDARIIQKLVWYLSTLEYWHDKDSGMWEEDEELHASSVGACVAGLRAAQHIDGVEVHPELIVKGETTLASMLPRESKRKFVDLALLSLIYPYEVVTRPQAEDILAHVEYHLLRKRGVIRYKGDRYYNKNEDGWSEEAEWTFGLSWLAIIYARLGSDDKAHYFLEEAKRTVTKGGAIPELYYSASKKHNENTPLGWSESLFVVAMHDVNRKRMHDSR